MRPWKHNGEMTGMILAILILAALFMFCSMAYDYLLGGLGK